MLHFNLILEYLHYSNVAMYESQKKGSKFFEATEHLIVKFNHLNATEL